ncbi:methyltransferase domain-containing protein [Halorientalis litorea]|jgi:tocopherol O-methyltransferase|uniref:methyltransferase domain-containing protein n=1 Tax=Halorientalis litorea TaxID=2931977 RepID=UPI001FF56948|nr:methyltransferase domain-containing protein [Halorientalis litorea]
MGGIDASRIAEYYTESHIDYRLFWGLSSAHGLHAGYHDEAHQSHAAAVENLNRVLADRADIGADDRMLDCGCGVGGSSVWVSDHRGATVQGIDLVPMQLQKARELARERGVDDRTAFARADFTDTPFADDSFDVLWGIEAICHAEDKADFVSEAARLLADGGRLVLSDGFRAAAAMTPAEREAMDHWLDGWAVPNLDSVAGFRDSLEAHGFTDVRVEDATEQVLPSSRRLYWASRVAAPVGRLLNRVGIRSDTQSKNRVAARYQHETLTDGLWTYNIVTANR